MKDTRRQAIVRGRTGRLPSSLPSIVAAAIVLVALGAGPAAAQEDSASADRDQIVLTGELLIAADDTVDSAVILDGPAQVDGTVRETLVVLNGDAEISGTVQEDVVVLNGDVVVRSGAEIGGDLVTQSAPEVEEGATIRGDRTNVITRFDFDLAGGFAGRLWWWFAYSASVLILGLLLLAFAPRLFPAVREAATSGIGSSIGWGFGLFFLLPIGSVLLLITLVGIPLGIFTLLALAFLYTLGYVVAIMGLGSRLLATTGSRFVAFLGGWVVLRLLALIPFVGGWLWFLGSVWGLGLLAVAIRRGHAGGTAAPPQPLPPMPVGVA
ncbi:MAG TPA: hypothetical protein VFW51_00785 [Actinomycetota bacterium]|nr:hypothetical protein [Actinomycetota bacterium]